MEQTARLIEMAEWLMEHPWYRMELCHEDKIPINDEEFLKIFRALEERGYYELMLVFLLKQSWDLDSVSQALHRFWTRRVFADWEKRGSAALFREFRELVEMEAVRRN